MPPKTVAATLAFSVLWSHVNDMCLADQADFFSLIRCWQESVPGKFRERIYAEIQETIMKMLATPTPTFIDWSVGSCCKD